MAQAVTGQHPRVGHVHLKVSDLDRAVRFYREVIGLDMIQLVCGRCRTTTRHDLDLVRPTAERFARRPANLIGSIGQECLGG